MTLKAVVISLSVLTLGSFGWSLGGFFVAPDGHMPVKMQRLKWFGTVFAIYQIFRMFAGYPNTFNWFLSGALYFTAGTLFWWTVYFNKLRPFKIAFTETAPTLLVTDGPHKIVRHPFYFAYILAWIAGMAAAPDVIQCLVVLGLIVTYRQIALSEEAGFRVSPLRDDYAEYQGKVGMLFPKLRFPFQAAK